MRALFCCLTLAPLLLVSAQAQQPEAPRTTGGFGPLGYFQDQCARCHGDYGAAYGDTFGAKLSDQQMLDVVKAMADGPAQAPLQDAQLQEETAFHLALRDKKPYIVATTWADGKLSGEAMPGSTVTLIQGDKTQTVELNGHQWQVNLDSGWAGAKLRAEKNGGAVEWELDKVNTGQ
jgi:hypothetical protein